VSLGVPYPESAPRLWGLALALLFLPPLLYATPRSRPTRFFALVAVACVPPLFTTLPQERVLMAATFGAFGVIASFLTASKDDPRRLVRIARPVFIGVNFVFAPLGFLLTLNATSSVERGVQALLDAVPRPAPRQVVLVDSPIELMSMYASIGLWPPGGELSHSLHQLYAGGARLSVTRIDSNTLEARVPQGYGRYPVERVFCAERDLPIQGTTRELLDLRVSVVETNARGLATRVRFRFADKLESSDRLWLSWHGTRPAAWAPPPVGETVDLPALGMLEALGR